MSAMVTKSPGAAKINAWVDPSLWRQFRGICVAQGVSPHRELEKLVQRFIDERGAAQNGAH